MTDLIPLRINLDPEIAGYAQILGASDTVRTKSGHVGLLPGASVGRHTTGKREEVIIVLEGRGRFKIDGCAGLGMEPNSVLYCPPDTFHDVENIGDSVLRYVYVVTGEKS